MWGQKISFLCRLEYPCGNNRKDSSCSLAYSLDFIFTKSQRSNFFDFCTQNPLNVWFFNCTMGQKWHFRNWKVDKKVEIFRGRGLEDWLEEDRGCRYLFFLSSIFCFSDQIQDFEIVHAEQRMIIVVRILSCWQIFSCFPPADCVHHGRENWKRMEPFSIILLGDKRHVLLLLICKRPSFFSVCFVSFHSWEINMLFTSENLMMMLFSWQDRSWLNICQSFPLAVSNPRIVSRINSIFASLFVFEPNESGRSETNLKKILCADVKIAGFTHMH